MCHGCQSSKVGRTIIPALDKKPIEAGRFESLQIDIVGPLVPSRGQRFLLTIVDRATRYSAAFPMSDFTAALCAETFIQQWVRHFGLPLYAFSDNGKAFIAKLWKDIHKRLSIKLIIDSPVLRAST